MSNKTRTGIISPDDHVIEPPDLWQNRLPSKFKEAGPRVRILPSDFASYNQTTNTWIPNAAPEGKPAAWWHFEDKIKPLKRNEAAAGADPHLANNYPVTFEDIRPGCWQPRARLADMDGVEASMCFPNYPRFSGQLFSEAKDRELGMACITAYNDWMVEEWCGDSGGRLIPLCMIPLWDAELAAAEVRRNAARGVRAVAFTEIPPWLGVPSIHSGFWDPLFDACNETSTVLSMHIGSGSRLITSSEDSPTSVVAVSIFNNTVISMTDFLSSGILPRFPNLKLFYAESQMGWIPYVLERADEVFAGENWRFPKTVAEPPSTYYHQHIYTCFYHDSTGIAQLDKIGVDKAMFETDYPHGSGTWPNSQEVAAGQINHLDPVVQEKILRGNAIALFGLSL
jgi:predicted TIM-barrel fold metal-dependent hydrolase